MATHLDLIVRLQSSQSALEEAQARLGGVPDWMEELHAEHTEQKAEIDAARAAGDEADRERRRLEGELEEARERLRHYQSQVSQVSTQREYGALLKEIDTVKAQISELETAALEAMETAETSRSSAEELEKAFEDLDSRYQEALAKWEEEKPDVAREAQRLESEVSTLRSEIPGQFLTLFDRLRERFGGHATARVFIAQGARGGNTMWHCEACSYNVRPQTIVEIRNEGQVVLCDSCKRILWWDDTEE